MHNVITCIGGRLSPSFPGHIGRYPQTSLPCMWPESRKVTIYCMIMHHHLQAPGRDFTKWSSYELAWSPTKSQHGSACLTWCLTRYVCYACNILLLYGQSPPGSMQAALPSILNPGGNRTCSTWQHSNASYVPPQLLSLTNLWWQPGTDCDSPEQDCDSPVF